MKTRLATVFAGPSFTGNYFSIEGIYRSCYNVLHNAKIGSVTLERGTAYCEIWGVEDCGEGEEGDGTYSRFLFAYNSHVFALLVGGFVCEGIVRS